MENNNSTELTKAVQLQLGQLTIQILEQQIQINNLQEENTKLKSDKIEEPQ